MKIASNSFDGGGGNGSGGGAGSLEEVTTDHRTSEKEFIARRRFALERFVNRVAQHPILRKGVVHQILSPISNSESTNIYYDIFFNSQTEKKH